MSNIKLIALGGVRENGKIFTSLKWMNLFSSWMSD